MIKIGHLMRRACAHCSSRLEYFINSFDELPDLEWTPFKYGKPSPSCTRRLDGTACFNRIVSLFSENLIPDRQPERSKRKDIDNVCSDECYCKIIDDAVL